MKTLALGVLLATALMVAAPARACGCGVALLADVTRERALVIERPGREEIILSLDLQPDGAGRAAIVLPVPADPEVEEIEFGDPLTYLDIATAPRVEPGGGGFDTAGVGGPPVDVIGRDTIGGYDVTRLRSEDAGALDAWLDENGYTLPDGAEPILADYVAEDWRYVAIRLAPGVSGVLKPLRVAFAADELVYPMRLSQLSSAPVDLTLYVLAEAERTVDGLDVEWSDRVSALEPEPPGEVAEVLSAGTWVTKLTASGADPASFTTDLAILGGTGDSGGADEGAPGWGPPLAIILALLGGAVLLVSRRSAA